MFRFLGKITREVKIKHDNFFHARNRKDFQNFIHEFWKIIHEEFTHAVKRKICKSQAQFLILKSVCFS